MQSQELKKHLSTKLKAGILPDKPGVYFFLDKNKKAIYIGKATSLKDRVKSYFPSTALGTGRLQESRGPLISDMVTKSSAIKWVETDSVLEALILEANLIKKHQPIYNTKEKSDKSFNYVCITKDKKIALVRGRLLDLKVFSSVFGPFPNGSQLRDALRIVRKIFPYIEDRRGAKGKEEFYKQIKLFPLDSKENKNNIKNIKLFFEGKKNKILRSLEKEMKSMANEHKFEQANEIKKQLFALKHINDIALIKSDSLAPGTSPLEPNFRIEAYDIAHISGKNMVGVMTVVEDGEANKNEYRKFKIKNYDNANDTGALLEVLERRFSHQEWEYPKLIVVDGGKAQFNTARKFQQKVGLAIPIVSVIKDDRHKPKGFLGDKNMIQKYSRQILLANSEAHRFSISYHRKLRGKIVYGVPYSNSARTLDK